MRFNELLRRRRNRDERGAVAIIVAALTIVLFMIAALAVDITYQVQRKNLLQNQLDAAATAAGYYLDLSDGGLARAVANAKAYYAANGLSEGWDDHKVDFWCVVARSKDATNADPYTADYEIPGAAASYVGSGVCNPDANGETNASTPKANFKQSNHQNMNRAWDSYKFSMKCGATLCAVPCGLTASPTNNWEPGTSSYNNKGITCNTIRIGAEQGVPFSFAPAGGIDQGSTGSQVAVACRGACGSIAPNPMDVVVVADRTNSMIDNYLTANTSSNSTTTTNQSSLPNMWWNNFTKDYRVDLVSGIKSMLEVMDSSQQYVTLSGLGPSRKSPTPPNNCKSYSVVDFNTNSNKREYGDEQTGSSFTVSGTTYQGTWWPLGFSNDYKSSTGLNTNSDLVKAVNCLASYNGKTTYHGTNTALASPLKAAARYLLGEKPNNLSSLNGRSGNIRKVIIFETDGQPRETVTDDIGTTNLTNPNDIFSDTEINNCDDGQVTDGGRCYANAATPACTSPSINVDGTCYRNFGPPTCSTSQTYNNSDGYCYTRQANATSCSGSYLYLITYQGSTNQHSSTTAQNDFAYCFSSRRNESGAGRIRSDEYNSRNYYYRNAQCSGSNAWTAVNGAYACWRSDSQASTCSTGGSPQRINGTRSCWANVGSACPNGTTYADHSGYSCWTDQGKTRWRGGQQACANFSQVAEKAKEAGILLIVIGYNLTGKTCADSNGTNGGNYNEGQLAADPTVTPNNRGVISVLAEAASGADNAWSANTSSSSACDPDENTDGDFFFCAAQGSDMASIFKTAITQVTSSVKLLNPNNF